MKVHFPARSLKSICSHYLETIQMVTSVLLMKMNTPESEKMRDDLWHYLEEKSPEGYKALKSSVLGKISKSHNKLSHKLTMGGYKIAQKWIGLTKKFYKNDIFLILFFLIIGLGTFSFMQLHGKSGALVKVRVNNKEFGS